MNLMRFAWRNLWRNRRRSLLQVLAIAGAIYLSTCFENLAMGEYEDIIRMGVRTGSGHVAVYRKGYLEERRFNLHFPLGPWVDSLKGLSGVEGVFPRLYVPGLARSFRASRAALIIGASSEDLATHPFLQKGLSGDLPRGRRAVVGRALAEALGLRPGRKFVVVVQDFGGELTSVLLRVSGIVETGVPEMDGGAVFMEREAFAALLGDRRRAHEVAVVARKGVRTRDLLARVRALIRDPDLEAVRWEKAMPELKSGIALDHTNLLLMNVLIFLIVSVGSLNVMFMSALERMREWGILRALGMRRRTVIRLVLIEGMLLGGVGMVAGSLLTVITTLITGHTGVDFRWLMGESSSVSFAGIAWEPVIYPRMHWGILVLYNLAMVLLSLLGSVLPARWAASLKPAEALRR